MINLAFTKGNRERGIKEVNKTDGQLIHSQKEMNRLAPDPKERKVKRNKPLLDGEMDHIQVLFYHLFQHPEI